MTIHGISFVQPGLSNPIPPPFPSHTSSPISDRQSLWNNGHIIYRTVSLLLIFIARVRQFPISLPCMKAPTHSTIHYESGITKWDRLAQNGTNPEIFFKMYWIWSEKISDLSHLGPIWPTLGSNLVSHPFSEFAEAEKHTHDIDCVQCT